MDKFDAIMAEPDFARNHLNLRNSEGQSPLYLIIKQRRVQMFQKLFDKFKGQIDLRSKEQIRGQTVLHLAVEQENTDFIVSIYLQEPELCLLSDYHGYSPFYNACLKEDLQIVSIFAPYKPQGMLLQDYQGFNVLHACARANNITVFEWLFDTAAHDFFRARGQQTYEGQTMEHVACIHKNVQLMRDIGPKFDTQDYYGNLPLHYTIMKDDTQMVEQYHSKFKGCIDKKNFRNETMLHIAAKHNSVESLKELVRNTVWIESLL